LLSSGIIDDHWWAKHHRRLYLMILWCGYWISSFYLGSNRKFVLIPWRITVRSIVGHLQANRAQIFILPCSNRLRDCCKLTYQLPIVFCTKIFNRYKLKKWFWFCQPLFAVLWKNENQPKKTRFRFCFGRPLLPALGAT
jgi:hypothetical protein